MIRTYARLSRVRCSFSCTHKIMCKCMCVDCWKFDLVTLSPMDGGYFVLHYLQQLFGSSVGKCNFYIGISASSRYSIRITRRLCLDWSTIKWNKWRPRATLDNIKDPLEAWCFWFFSPLLLYSSFALRQHISIACILIIPRSSSWLSYDKC